MNFSAMGAVTGLVNHSGYPANSANSLSQSEQKQVPPASVDAVHQASEEESIASRPVDSAKQAEQQAGNDHAGDQQPNRQSDLLLSQQDKLLIDQLKQRDQEVRTHEQAHIAASNGHASSPTYQYQKGPDGRLYAESGHVSIDTSKVSGDPQATIEKMQAVIQSANAPAQPSAQDRKVAAQATVMLNDAMGELAELQLERQKIEQTDRLAKAADTPEDQANKNPQKESATHSPQQASQERQQQNAEARTALERKFVDSGVFAKAFPQGSLVNSFL